MAGLVRRAGHGRGPDGSLVTWSVAEGRRGRRWREVRVREMGEGSGVMISLLLELNPEGRFSHLELSTSAGLLTLHPEGDGTIHGNDVGAAGVGHVVAVPWNRDDVVLVEGSIVSLVAAAAPAGTPRARTTGGIVVGLDLSLARADVTVAASRDGWLVEPGGWVAIDADGLPTLVDGLTWPLEQDG